MKMNDSITDGPRHPDEDAEYDEIRDIMGGIPKPFECSMCKEISMSLKRIDGDIEEWECCSCGHQENYGRWIWR